MEDRPPLLDSPVHSSIMGTSRSLSETDGAHELATAPKLDDPNSNRDNKRKRPAEDGSESNEGSSQPRALPPEMALPNGNRTLSTIAPMAKDFWERGHDMANDAHAGIHLPFQPQMPMAASATSDQSSDPQNNSMLQLPAYNTFFGIPPMQFQQMILEQMRRVPQIAAGGQAPTTMAIQGLAQGFPLPSPQQPLLPPGNIIGNAQSLGVDGQDSTLQLQQSSVTGFMDSSLAYAQSSMMSGNLVSSTTLQAGSNHGESQSVGTDDSRLSGRPPIGLYMSCDEEALSEYQCLVRKNIELFEALPVDVESNAQGRNKPIVLGQVGIRCRHCALLPPKKRARGAAYYPSELKGLYQAAQNQAKGHLEKHCNHIPPATRAELLRLKDSKSSAGSGKNYWADGVRVLGVYEDRQGLRFEKRTSPTNQA